MRLQVIPEKSYFTKIINKKLLIIKSCIKWHLVVGSLLMKTAVRPLHPLFNVTLVWKFYTNCWDAVHTFRHSFTPFLLSYCIFHFYFLLFRSPTSICFSFYMVMSFIVYGSLQLIDQLICFNIKISFCV
jgi:hypothetical protein